VTGAAVAAEYLAVQTLDERQQSFCHLVNVAIAEAAHSTNKGGACASALTSQCTRQKWIAQNNKPVLEQ
jgi:hypothetical protein